MTAERLLKLFDRVADAKDAVPRLRRLLLDLAVRGKLTRPEVELDSVSDASLRLADTDRDQPDNADSSPFEIPEQWRWQPFRLVGAIETNLVNPRQYREHPHIAPDNIEARTGRLLAYESVANSGVISGKHLFRSGQLLYSKIRPALAKVAAVDFEGLCSADMYPVRPLIDRRYLLLYMFSEAFIAQTTAVANRVSMPKIKQDALNKVLVAVPPSTEQRRIVAKVDELMAVCDELEKAQAKREANRRALSRTVVSGLAQNPLKRSPRLFDREAKRAVATAADVGILRQAVLDLAVRGRLVRQQPGDESVQALIGQITQLTGRSVPTASSPAAPVPDGWVVARFGDVTRSRDGERIPVSKDERATRPKLYDYYGASGVIDKIDGFLFDKPLLLIGEDGANLLNRSTPIAFIARGRYWVNNHAHVIDGPSELYLRYLELFINATDLAPYVTGTAQPKMNQAKMNSIPVAVPPPGEMARIVAKVDELMALCDRLEGALTIGDTTRSKLLDALIAEALASPAPVTA